MYRQNILKSSSSLLLQTKPFCQASFQSFRQFAGGSYAVRNKINCTGKRAQTRFHFAP